MNTINISNVGFYEFTTDVEPKEIHKNFIHCHSDGNLYRDSQTLIKNESQFAKFQNTAFITTYNPFRGTFITNGWEIDKVSDTESKVRVYSIAGSKFNKRFEGFAKGISEKSSIMYNACKF